MNWDVLGAIGETIESVAVFATLVYLAVQIRQNTAALKASSHHAITDSFNAINVKIIEDPATARLWRLGHADQSLLDEDEQAQYASLMLAYMRIFETLFYQREVGTMEEKLFQTEEKTLRWSFLQPGFVEWWDENPISLSTEFREYVNGLRNDAGT